MYELALNTWHEIWVELDTVTPRLYIWINGQIWYPQGFNIGTSGTQGNIVRFRLWSHPNFAYECWFDYLYRDTDSFKPDSKIDGMVTTKWLHFDRVPHYWGKCFKQETLGNGTIVYETESVDDFFGGGSDGWKPVNWAGNVGTIQSALKKLIRWRAKLEVGWGTRPEIDEFWMPGSIISGTIDATTPPKSISLDWFQTISGHEVKRYTESSEDGVNWDAVVEQTNGYPSALKRYVRWRWIVSKTTTSPPAKLEKIHYHAELGALRVMLGNFLGKSIKEILQEIAKIGDYEQGCKADGTYFLRIRDVTGEPDFEFYEGKNLISITNYIEGWDRVYNLIESKYSSFEKKMSPETEQDTKPNSYDKYDKRRLSLSESRLTIDPTLNITERTCQIFFQRYKNPNIRLRAQVKPIFQLDLSDKVRFHTADLKYKLFKVVGITLRLSEWRMVLDAVQIGEITPPPVVVTYVVDNFGNQIVDNLANPVIF